MALTGNELSGKESAKMIVENSLFMKHIYKPGSSTLRPLNGELLDLTKDMQIGMTMVNTAQFVCLPLYIPEIYEKSGDPNTRLMMKGLFKLICDVATNVQLFEDESLEVIEPTFKNALNTPMLTNLTGIPKRISLGIPAEYSNFFILNVIRHWQRQIHDPYSRTSPYNGLTTEWNNYSHTGGIAYWKPNPNGTRIDAGAIVMMMAPITAPTSNLNSDANSPGVPNYTLEFTATVIDYTNKRAFEILDSLRQHYREYQVMDSTLVGVINGTTMDMMNFDAEKVMESYKNVEQ